MSWPRKLFFSMLIAALTLAIGYWLNNDVSRQKAERFAQSRKEMEARQALPNRITSLPGDEILRNYAQPGTRPEDDLDSMAHAFLNLMLLVKGDFPFHMGANEEFAAALLGKNRSHQRFVSENHRAFNAEGQLTDRWGTPLYFHTVGQDRVDIRSAGPDCQMWTADDLHRHYDGSFQKGDQLNPKSLFEPAEGKTRR